jgi:N-acetylglucosamine kinase-like BadF-type ATPase
MPDKKPHLFIGVDGGQSSTLALVADEDGNVLGSGSAGPSNHIYQPGGEERFRTAIGGSVQRALEAAGAPHSAVAVIGMGLTGHSERMRSLATSLFPGNPVVTDWDALSALYGASGGHEGVVLIAGTGSVGFGQAEDGREARAGGYGHLASDEGSGYWVGLEGLKAAFRALDGRSGATPLSELVPARFGASDLNTVQRILYTGEEDRALIAAIARDVAEAAAQGDRVAQGILHHAALHLANLVAAVYRKLWTDEEIACYEQGGMFGSRYLEEQLGEWLEKLAPNVRRKPAQAPPAVGALVMAYKARGIEPDDLDWNALKRGAVAKTAHGDAHG